MNVTIDKTAAEVARMVEHGVMVVNGETMVHHLGPFGNIQVAAGGQAPADLVALTKPCPHCQAVVDRQYPRHHPDHCPDCEGRGFPLLTVTAIEVCGSCNGHDIAHSGDVGSSCYSCNGGMIEVPAFTARVTDVVLVVQSGTRPDLNDYVLVNFDPSGSGAVFKDGQLVEVIDLPPDTRPGQFVVICEVQR